MARPPYCNRRWFEDCSYPNCKCIEEKPFTLKDYSEFILQPMVNKMAIDILYGQMQMFPPGPPLTRKQKFRWWIEDKKQRCKDIWTILSGGDIHENCGDY